MTRAPIPSWPGRLRQALSANPLLVDASIAAALTALSLFALLAGAPDLGPAGPLNLVLLLLQTVPLVVRRRFPVAVLVVVAGALVAQLLILPGGADLRASVGLLVALYTIGEQVERRQSGILTLMTSAVVAALMIWHEGLPDVLQALIQTMFFFGAAWYVGVASRIRRLYTQALEEQALLLRREREERARRAIDEERERIARELHDVVAHGVSVIVIQAGGGLRALHRRPADTRTALEAIDVTARQALIDMRRMLGILGEREIQEPMPRLDRLGDLLDQMRSAGLAVELTIEGERRPLDPGLELSAFRIIQEGLTNSLKHAGAGRARLTVRYLPASLEVVIDDERGHAPAARIEPEHVGRGLLGMRERVAMFRGTFAAEPTPTGFRVAAALPLDDATVS